MCIILYLAIGVVVTEFTTINNYEKFTIQNFVDYSKEVSMWLPNLLIFYFKDNGK